jgi:hypothetical protein
MLCSGSERESERERYIYLSVGEIAASILHVFVVGVRVTTRIRSQQNVTLCFPLAAFGRASEIIVLLLQSARAPC